MQAVYVLEMINKISPKVAVEWYKNVKGLRPNISAELEEKLNIK